MIDLKVIDDLTRRLGEALPPGAQRLRSEMEEQFRAVLSRSLQKLDLVRREEFDAQVAVLERTRIKLESLERQLVELEKDQC